LHLLYLADKSKGTYGKVRHDGDAERRKPATAEEQMLLSQALFPIRARVFDTHALYLRLLGRVRVD